MNVLDSELMIGKLARKGWIPVEDARDADLVLYNTCAIREKSVHKLVSALGKNKHLRKTRPHVKFGVLGCVGQLKGDELFSISPQVDFVVGTDHLDRIDEVVEAHLENPAQRSWLDKRDTLDFGREASARPTPFQAYVSVMRGCDLYCTYCVVPETRGRERSRPAGEILDEIRQLVDDGVVEVCLLGQTVNAYGRKDDRGTFAELLHAVNKIDGLERIRFVTSHPKWMTEDLIEAMGACDKVLPWLHLPAQSGSNSVLKRMKRLYTREQYLDIIHSLKERIPQLALATDLIVGFSGETDDEFEDTVTLVQEVGYQTAYIFKYSEREGTFASRKLPDDVPDEIKRDRNQILLQAQDKTARHLNMSRIGQEVEVLIERESTTGDGRMMGRDRHYWNMAVDGDPSMIGTTVACRITDATALTLYAEPIEVARA